MSFKLTCPKCGTSDYSIERDSRLAIQQDPTANLIFSCRCGKQMFGTQVFEEYERQHKEWEQLEAQRRQRVADEPSEAPTATLIASNRPDEADADPTEDLSPSADGQTREVRAEAPVVAGTCQWGPCDNPCRPNSKYCSRDCSNKNARWRHKQRRRTTGDAVVA